MDPENPKMTIRRILVPMDESGHSRAALETAVSLAAALRAEISGLYVEDNDLLELCQYPFFREVCRYECRPLKSDEMVRDLKLQAERIRRLLSRFADSADVGWTFEVRRGGVRNIVLEQTNTADITIMGRTGRTVLRSTMGSTVRHLILYGRGLTMFIQEGFRLEPPIRTVYTGSETSKKGLDIGTDIARMIGGDLVILIPAANREAFQKLKQKAGDMIKDTALPVRCHPIHVPATRGIVLHLQSEYRKLLILPADTVDSDPERMIDLINRINNPVLLVR